MMAGPGRGGRGLSGGRKRKWPERGGCKGIKGDCWGCGRQGHAQVNCPEGKTGAHSVENGGSAPAGNGQESTGGARTDVGGVDFGGVFNNVF